METVFILLAAGALNVVCFLIGAKVGQTVAKDEPVELPNLNPIEAYRENRAEEESKKESKLLQEQIETIAHNIEIYDGTSNGQRDIPM
jgi:hypothetical protein